jgi:MFS family permease
VTTSGARISLGPVLLVNFIGTMGFTIVIPFLVFLVTRYGGNALVYGLVAATYPAFQFLAAPVLGRWSDRYGRKRVLLLSQVGTLVSWLVFMLAFVLPTQELLVVDAPVLGSFAVTLPLLVIGAARALDGLTGGNISVANAYVADVSTPETRNRNFGRMGVAANFGMVLGPGLASVLGATRYGPSLPVLAAALIALVGVGVIAFGLPESNPNAGLPECPRDEPGQVLGAEPRDCVAAARQRQASVPALLREPNVAFMMALYFTILLSFNFYYIAFPVHAARNLEWDVTQIGVFFAVLSTMIVVVEGPILSRVSKRLSESTLILIGLPILGTNFLLMSSPRIELLYLGAMLFAVGTGLIWPSVVSMVSKVAPDRFQGAVQGVAGSVGSLASIVGLVLGGVTFSAYGVGTFLLSAGIAYGAFVMAWRLPRIAAEAA